MLADVIIIAVILLSTYLGYKNGFIRTVSKLISFVVSIVIAKILHPVVCGYVRNSFVGDFINSKIADKALGHINENSPLFIQKIAGGTVNELTDILVNVVTVVILIIIAYLVVYFLIKALDLVSKLPVISWLNRLLGFVAGIFMGIITVYVILAVVAVVNPDATWVENSYIATVMFMDNYIINIFF